MKKLLRTSGTFIFGSGTEERWIKSGIVKEFGSYIEVSEFNDHTAKKKFDNVLSKEIPIFICVDEDWGHYMVIAAKIGEKYLIIDSGGSEEKTIFYYNWKQLAIRLCNDCEYCEGEGVEEWCEDCEGTGKYDGEICSSCNEKGYYNLCSACKGTGEQYWGLGIVLNENNKNYSSYTLNGSKNLIKYHSRLFKDSNLQEYWGYYLDDLKKIFELNLTGKNVIKVTDFFKNHSDQIVEMVGYWMGECKHDIQYELDSYRFVAEFYDFKFRKKDTEGILINFTSMFTVAMATDEWEEDC